MLRLKLALGYGGFIQKRDIPMNPSNGSIYKHR